MNKLTFALLVHYFGGNATRPKRTAFVRLTILFCSAAALSIILGMAVRDINLPVELPWWLVSYLILFFMQCATCVSLLCSSALIKNSAALKWLQSVPIPLRRQWWLSILPHAIMSATIFIMFIGPIMHIGWAVSLPFWLSLLGTSIGCLCGFALLQPLPHTKQLMRNFGGVLFIATQFMLLRSLILHPATPRTAATCTALFIMAILPFTLVLYSYHHIGDISTQTRVARKPVITLRSPQIWMLVKGLRNHYFRTSLVAAGVICLAVSWLTFLSPMRDPSLISFCCALIAASCASDIRRIAAKINPPEIVGLRGTFSFLRNTYLLYICIFIILLPLLYLMVTASGGVLACSFYLSHSILGIVVGNAVGSYLTPTKHDVSTQYMAVLCSGGLLWILLQSNLMASFTLGSQLATILFFAMVFEACRFYIEYKRNTFTWR